MRIETGYAQFGDDWKCIVIRGDNALYYGQMLKLAAEKLTQDDDLFFVKQQIDGMAKFFSGVNQQVQNEVQQLKPFDECIKAEENNSQQVNKITYEKALQIATKAHLGQTRWNGDPYITHPIRVSSYINFGKSYADYGKTDEENEILAIVAVMHDTLEDTKLTEQDLVNEGFGEVLINVIKTLTKSDKDTYLDYILRIKKNPIARIVKLADLKDNLSDLNAIAHKTLRDKYLLAQEILKSQ